MYYVMTDRERLVSFLPPGAVAAEIGVAYGDFSQVMLDRARPSQLHLIDPWSHNEASDHDPRGFLDDAAGKDGPAPAPAYNEGGEKIYRDVCARFAGRSEVAIHRQFSYRIAQQFPERHFDFVYLDGNHTYEFVLQDLLDFGPKVKDEGLIIGHDFFEDAYASQHRYGVIDAVHRFLHRSRDFRLACLTYEPFQSFVLARKATGFAGQFFYNLLESDVFIVEMADDQAFRYEEKQYIRRDGQKRRIPSFAP